MKDILHAINELFDEGTFAFSDRIVGLSDEDLEVDPDEDIEAILASEELRRITLGR